MPLGPRKAYIARFAAVIVLAVVAVAALNITHGHLHVLILDTSTVLAAIMAIWTILGTSRPPPIPAGKEYDNSLTELKGAILSKESQQRLRLLDNARIPAQARLTAAAFLRSHRTGAAPMRFDWRDAFDVYWGLAEPKRMLILGEPGGGKTLLLLEIIQQAYGSRHAQAVPALVRVNAAEWTADKEFEEFFTNRVVQDYKLSSGLVSRMYNRGDLIPLLDGLDEVDSDEGVPTRGRAIIERLNVVAPGSYPIDRPLILACRREYFEKLEEIQAGNNEPIGLAGAVSYVLEQLDANQILSYLRANLTDEARQRWQPTIKAISAGDSHLARILGSPWMLMLAFRAYLYSGTPADFLNAEHGEKEIEERLLPYFFTVAMERHGVRVRANLDGHILDRTWGDLFGVAPRNQRRIARWLKQVAIYLDDDLANGGGGELRLDQAYRMVSKQTFSAFFYVSTFLAFAGIGSLFVLVAIEGGHPFIRIVAICFTAVFLTIAARAVIRGGPGQTPASSTLRKDLTTPRGSFDLISAFAVAFAASAFTLGTQDTLMWRVFGGIVCGFLGGLAFGFVQARRLRSRGAEMSAAEKPADPLRSRLVTGSITAAIFAVGYAAILLLADAGIEPAVIFAICTLVIFVHYATPVTSVAWVQYRLGVLILFVQDRLPWRLEGFLQWNYDAGLIRTSGTAYQFRHLRLQKWLAVTDEAHLLPR